MDHFIAFIVANIPMEKKIRMLRKVMNVPIQVWLLSFAANLTTTIIWNGIYCSAWIGVTFPSRSSTHLDRDCCNQFSSVHKIDYDVRSDGRQSSCLTHCQSSLFALSSLSSDDIEQDDDDDDDNNNNIVGNYMVDNSVSCQKLLQFLEDEECEGIENTEIGSINTTILQDGRTVTLRGIYAKESFQPGEYICAIPFVSTLLIDETFLPSDGNDEDENNNSNDDNDTNNKEIQSKSSTATTKELLKTRLSAARIENAIKFWKKFLLPSGIANNNDNAAASGGNNNNNNNNKNKWKPYLDYLPKNDIHDPNFTPTPDFWPNEYIQRLELPSIVSEMMSRKNEITDYLVSGTTGTANGDADDEAISLNDDDDDDIFKNEEKIQIDLSTLQYVAWLVRTRAFTTLKKAMTIDGTKGLLQRTVMIPYLDLFNHDSMNSNVQMEVVETKIYDESFYALIATRSIKKGEELRIEYGTGEETSIQLFGKYGFIPNDNHMNDLSYIFEDVRDRQFLQKSSAGSIISQSPAKQGEGEEKEVRTTTLSQDESRQQPDQKEQLSSLGRGWTTTLDEDEEALQKLVVQSQSQSKNDNNHNTNDDDDDTEIMITILNFRIYLKRLALQLQ